MIQLIEIKGHGNLSHERALFRVTESGDIGKRVVYSCVSRLEDGTPQLFNEIRAAYWFLDEQVKMGDLVVLYTKDSDSQYKTKEAKDGHTTHFFYWGLNATLWDKLDTALVHGVFSGWSTHHLRFDGDDVEP